MRGLDRNRAERRKLGIGSLVAGQESERDAALARQPRQAVDAVGPVAAPAEDASDDELRGRCHPLDMEIDRVVVAEPHEVGEPQARPAGARREAALRRREAGDLAVRRRQDDDVARALAEIDRGAAVGDGSGLGGEEVHA